jgi:hypothetical protein
VEEKYAKMVPSAAGRGQRGIAWQGNCEKTLSPLDFEQLFDTID